jgi:hypothetical protein
VNKKSYKAKIKINWGWGMRANPYLLEFNYRFQDRRGLYKNCDRSRFILAPTGAMPTMGYAYVQGLFTLLVRSLHRISESFSRSINYLKKFKR